MTRFEVALRGQLVIGIKNRIERHTKLNGKGTAGWQACPRSQFTIKDHLLQAFIQLST